MNSAVFRKIMEKGRERRDIKLATTKTRKKSGIGTKLSNNKIFISNKNDTPEQTSLFRSINIGNKQNSNI